MNSGFPIKDVVWNLHETTRNSSAFTINPKEKTDKNMLKFFGMQQRVIHNKCWISSQPDAARMP